MIAWFAGQPLWLKMALGALGGLLLSFSLWLLWLRKYLEWQNVKTLDIQERVGLKIEFIKTGAQIVGGLFFVLTILVAYRNYEVSQKNLELAQEKQVTELYVKAIDQLGSNKLEVILGGIYALERIARNSKKDKGPILEVLTAYVRENAPWPPEDPAMAQKRRPWTKKSQKVTSPAKEVKPGAGRPEPGKNEKGEESKPEPDTDIQAMLTVIGRLGPAHDGQGKPQILDLRRTDLRGADLSQAHLEGAFLSQAHLEGAFLSEAHLEGANLEGAKLVDSQLVGAYFGGSHLERAYLMRAHLEDAYLMRAHLEGASLREAHLEDASLAGALPGASGPQRSPPGGCEPRGSLPGASGPQESPPGAVGPRASPPRGGKLIERHRPHPGADRCGLL